MLEYEGKLLMRYGAMEFFVKKYEVTACVNCRRVICLGKLHENDQTVFQSYLRHYRCPRCQVFCALMQTRLLSIVLVAALDPKVMDVVSGPTAIAKHIQEVFAWALPKQSRFDTTSGFHFANQTDQMSDKPLWVIDNNEA